MRFMLEVLPEEGFGHINFIAWPAARANVLFQLATSPWAHYRSAYLVTETTKYILSKMGDKRFLNELSSMGVTALGMAAQYGASAVCKILLEAGMDPNAGFARTPSNAAVEWLKKSVPREQKAWKGTEPGEKNLASKLRNKAQDTVDMLISYGGIDRRTPMNVFSALTRGELNLPAPEILFELTAGLFFSPGPRGNLVNQGTLRTLPAKYSAALDAW
ncbi:uncharacterized protein A1O9_06914 [Exophiala aquamarina CBS 119918]|uniref:Uncharacterized protein n=1 Tax=Exophiala aquamarina CBS 119918 TaxID=1182545 RepID=A0A072P9D7_9EURO|nr:uncharacterized protein A1O9_06914 [Exophiala aquamarina CBS 119918]KEF56724.1 hypothetical protein A1O9_06914 [Exophiala aquamarina CBS 119918]